MTQLQEIQQAYTQAKNWEAMARRKHHNAIIEGERTGDHTAAQLAAIEVSHATREVAKTAELFYQASIPVMGKVRAVAARFDLECVPRDMLPLFNAVDELIA